MQADLSVAEAEEGEREAFAAIGELGRGELEAVKIWIAADCEGARPKPDEAERERLALRLSAAIEARQAAELTAGGLSRLAASKGQAEASSPSVSARRALPSEKAA